MIPDTLVVKLTIDQKNKFGRILREYHDIKKGILYEAIVEHGINAIYRKNKWEIEKKK